MADTNQIPIPTPTPYPTSSAPAPIDLDLTYLNVEVASNAVQGWNMVGIGQQLQAGTLVITFFFCTALVVVTLRKTFGGRD
jgi:hypothetical protein